MRLPLDRTSANRSDVSSLGLPGPTAIWVASMNAREVGLDGTVNIQVACGFHDHPHATSAVQVANESLDGGGVTLHLVVTEHSNLADSEIDVRASVGAEVQQHADFGAVAPRFFHRRSVGVDSRSTLSSWRPVIFAVGAWLHRSELFGTFPC